MPNPQNIEPYKFKPGQCGNPKGRPKNRVPGLLAKVMPKSKAKKFAGLTNEEVDSWEVALLTMQLDEITNLAKEPEAPVYVRGLAMAILTDTKKGETKTIDKLREHVFGKTKQTVELTGANGNDLIPARVLTKEEAKEFLSELENSY